MDFIDDVRLRSSRFAKRVEHILTEGATKSALVQPFIQMLGYDIFDPQEVIPEFAANVGIKKDAKVDYALVLNGKPTILVEAKVYGHNLDKADTAQLRQYFHATDARFGVLTDGIAYRFFSDMENANRMDTHPFFEFNMLDFTDAQVAVLKRFTKDSFNLGKAQDVARNLKYLADIKRILATELDSPSHEFVSFFRKRVFEKPPSSKVKGQFEPRVKEAFGQFIKDHIKERFQSALAQDEMPPVAPDSPTAKEGKGKKVAEALVMRWATEHGGEVALMDCARAAVADGIFPEYRMAYNMVYRVLHRHSEITKVAPGRYALKDGEGLPGE